MSIFQDMKEEVNKLKSEIQELLEIDRDELYGKDRLHELSFLEHGKESFEEVFELIKALSKCYFKRTSLDQILAIRDYLDKYKKIFERAKSLDLTKGGDIKGKRDQIVKDIEDHYTAFLNCVSPFINSSNQTGADLKQIESEARQILDSTKKYFETQKKQIEDILKTAESILESIRISAAEAGVSQTATHYKNAKENHKKNADKWFKWGKGLLFLLIGFISLVTLSFVCFKYKELPVFGYSELAVLVTISLWIYAINFCNKNFHAEKHNETINANKANTLATFLSFVDSTENKNVKDQVLIYASASAFSNPTTGFNKDQGVPLPPGIELTKQIITQSSKNS